MARQPLPANTASAYADIQAIRVRVDLTPAEKRAAIQTRRGDAAEAAAQASPLSVLANGLDVAATRVTRRGNSLHVVVDAPLAPDLIEHVCHNPPILVPDPAGSIVVERKDVFGEVIGEKRYREDPRAALEAWLRQSLESVL